MGETTILKLATQLNRWLVVASLALTAPVNGQESLSSKPKLDQPIRIDYKLPEIRNDGKAVTLSLKELKGDKKLVLFFFSEQCGVTYYYKNRIQLLQKEFEAKGFVFVGVRGGRREAPDRPLEIAETKYLKMPFLDDAKGELVSAFKVGRSVTFDVIDQAGKLRYRGGFDDNVDAKKVKKSFLRSALISLAANKPIAIREGDGLGCAIIPIKP